jgi:hypothetical protein
MAAAHNEINVCSSLLAYVHGVDSLYISGSAHVKPWSMLLAKQAGIWLQPAACPLLLSTYHNTPTADPKRTPYGMSARKLTGSKD